MCEFITHPATPAGDEADDPDTVPAASAPLGAKEAEAQNTSYTCQNGWSPASGNREAPQQLLAKRRNPRAWAGPGRSLAGPARPSGPGAGAGRIGQANGSQRPRNGRSPALPPAGPCRAGARGGKPSRRWPAPAGGQTRRACGWGSGVPLRREAAEGLKKGSPRTACDLCEDVSSIAKLGQRLDVSQYKL